MALGMTGTCRCNCRWELHRPVGSLWIMGNTQATRGYKFEFTTRHFHYPLAADVVLVSWRVLLLSVASCHAATSYRIIIRSNISLISGKARLSRENDELTLPEALQVDKAARMELFQNAISCIYKVSILRNARMIYKDINLYYKLSAWYKITISSCNFWIFINKKLNQQGSNTTLDNFSNK